MSGKTPRKGYRSEQYQAMALIADGHTYREVAERIGKSRQTITLWAGTEGFKEQVAKIRQRRFESTELGVRKVLERDAKEAATKLTMLMQRSSSDVVQLKAATSILDRSGHGPSSKIEVDSKALPDEQLCTQILPDIIKVLGAQRVMDECRKVQEREGQLIESPQSADRTDLVAFEADEGQTH